MKRLTIGTVVALLGCSSMSGPGPLHGEVSYTLTATENITADSINYDDGAGRVISLAGPALPWSQSVQFTLPGRVRAHARLIAVGPATAKLRAAWIGTDTTLRDSATVTFTEAGVVSLDIPLHLVSANSAP